MKTLLDQYQLDIVLQRLAHQLVENHLDFRDAVIIGLQPRGIYLSDRIVSLLHQIRPGCQIRYGKLDITFYRDDLHHGHDLHAPANTDIPFSIEGRKVVLIDDVLHTGRTIRAAMDALLGLGRPALVELLVLIDRHYSRQLPIQPDYAGRTIDTVISQSVKVYWAEKDSRNEVVLIN